MLDATRLLKLYAKRRLARLAALDPVEEQEKQLLGLVRRAGLTRFGRAHDFGTIRSVGDFQRRVPLRRYEDFWRDWWQPAYPKLVDVTWPGAMPFFAASSGTTSGNTKFIPVSRQMVAGNRRAVLDLLSHHVAARPDTHILGGSSFMLGGSTALNRPAPGVRSGDLSGIAASGLPWWAKGRYFPPPGLACIADWNEKVNRLAPLSLQADLRLLGGTASWLLAFVERALAERPGATILNDIYPALELLVHGGVNFAPYRRRFSELLDGSRAETREVYPASEGFVALADRTPADGLRLFADNGLFFEFVPLEELGGDNPTRHWLRDVEVGQNYAIVLSTNAGLWSYVLGDTIRFLDRSAARLVVTGRTSYSLSAFGEHLIGEEIEAAVTAAAHAIEADVVDYSVGALYPGEAGERGRHLYIVEFSRPVSPEEQQRFVQEIDWALIAANLDYREHRGGDVQMLAPLLRIMPPGGFARWMESRGKLGAQNKVPRVINDRELWTGLQDSARISASP